MRGPAVAPQCIRAASRSDRVGQAVVRPVNGGDGPQMGWPPGGCRNRHHCTVRDTPHADGAVAPILGGGPLDHRGPVGSLDTSKVVGGGRRPGRRTVTSHVDEKGGIASCGQLTSRCFEGVPDDVIFVIGVHTDKHWLWGTRCGRAHQVRGEHNAPAFERDN